MKSYKSTALFFGILGLLVLTSCTKKYLAPRPESFYTPENTYNTASGLEAGLQAAAKTTWYEHIGPTAPYNTQLYFSDEGVNGGTDVTTAKDFVADLSPDEASLKDTYHEVNILWYWKDVFIGIKYANTVISYIDLPDWDTTKPADLALRNSILGSAYFWRAYNYFFLCNCFGDVPWVGKLYTVPKLDFNTTERKVILEKLRDDLTFAAQWVTNDVNKGQVTNGAVLHLLTKVNLALGDFDAAIQSASKLIDGGAFHLMTQRFGVDAGDASKNVIWDLHRPENKSLAQNTEALLLSINREDVPGNLGANSTMRDAVPYWASNIVTPNGNKGTSDKVGIEFDLNTDYGRGVAYLRPTWYPTHAIWNTGAGDLRHAPGNWMRMEDLVYNNPALKGSDSYYGKPLQEFSNSGTLLVADTVRSWFGWPHYKLYVYNPNTASSQQNGGFTDWYIYRLAETYLLRAEAYWWKGDLPDATADLNIVRARAGADPLLMTQVDMATILDERARELYYEEPRKMVLTRIAYLFAQTGKAAPTGKTYNLQNFSKDNFWYDWTIQHNEFYRQQLTIPIGSKYTISPHMVWWPIPQSAIDANIDGIINQNEGYTGFENNIPPLDKIEE